jgi:hypothetical protein
MTTTHGSLTDRYITTALKGVPADRRVEAEANLHTTIDAAIAARVEGGESTDVAEKEVLTGLGDPMRRSAHYSGRQLYLIGPDFYPEYVRLLRLLFSIVVPIIAVVVGLASATAGAGPSQAVLAGLGAAFSVGVQVVLWVTVVFAIVDRTAKRPREASAGWDLSDLPELPSNRVGLGETVGSICGLALLAWVLVWQPGYQETFDAGGPSIPILDPTLNSFWIPFLIGVVGITIVMEIVMYRVGHWTIPLAVVNTVLSLAFAIPVIWLIATGQLLNPEFESAVGTGEFARVAELVPTLVGWVIGVICAVDIADGWWKALRSAQS